MFVKLGVCRYLLYPRTDPLKSRKAFTFLPHDLECSKFDRNIALMIINIACKEILLGIDTWFSCLSYHVNVVKMPLTCQYISTMKWLSVTSSEKMLCWNDIVVVLSSSKSFLSNNVFLDNCFLFRIVDFKW